MIWSKSSFLLPIRIIFPQENRIHRQWTEIPFCWSKALSGPSLHAPPLPPACCWFPAPRWGRRHSWQWQIWCGSVPGCSSGHRSSSAACLQRSGGVSSRGSVHGCGFALWGQLRQKQVLLGHLCRRTVLHSESWCWYSVSTITFWTVGRSWCFVEEHLQQQTSWPFLTIHHIYEVVTFKTAASLVFLIILLCVWHRLSFQVCLAERKSCGSGVFGSTWKFPTSIKIETVYICLQSIYNFIIFSVYTIIVLYWSVLCLQHLWHVCLSQRGNHPWPLQQFLPFYHIMNQMKS